MKRIISTLLAFVLLIMGVVTTLSSCKDDSDDTPQTEENTKQETETVDTGIKKIYVVCPTKTTDAIDRLVRNTRKLITEKTGIETELAIDSVTAYEAKEDCYYVIFGDTSYEQSKALAQKAEDNKMYYAAAEDSVAVYAKTEQLLVIAAEKLFAECVKDGSFKVDDKYASLVLDGSDYVRDGWVLNFPAFKRGKLDSKVYNTGMGIDADKDASRMQVVGLMTSQGFVEYKAQLEAAGYVKDFENEIEGNLYASYTGVLGTNIYVYFTKAKMEIKIIEDNVSTPLSEFNYKLDASKDTRLYAFKMAYKSEDCFLIHLADNSWFVIDGGYTGEIAGSKYVKDLYNFMAERSNLKDGEKLQISCWYLTHAHSDHFFGMYGLIHEYGDKVIVHRVVDNTPVDGYMVIDYRKQYERLLKKIRTDNPDVMYLKVHTGMKINVADTSAEVLFTHEDIIYDYQGGSTSNPNRISLIAVFDIAGLTFLETADNMTYNNYSQYSIDKITTDVLKIAHHYYDKSMDTLYEKLYKTGKVSYCYNPRWESTANAANNYQAPTMALFGSKYLQGSETKIYEFYRSGSSVKMNVIYD